MVGNFSEGNVNVVQNQVVVAEPSTNTMAVREFSYIWSISIVHFILYFYYFKHHGVECHMIQSFIPQRKLRLSYSCSLYLQQLRRS